MIDSADKDRIDEARLELERILADREMTSCLLMVFANKQDMPGGELFITVPSRLGPCALLSFIHMSPDLYRWPIPCLPKE